MKASIQQFLAKTLTESNWKQEIDVFKKQMVKWLQPTPQENTALHVYIDGSCQGNPGPGAWAACFCVHAKYGDACQEEDICMADRVDTKETTNNRSEITALVKALELLPQLYDMSTLSTIHIYSDSLYVVRIATKKWKIKSNHDLWKRYKTIALDNVQYHWIKAHNGHPQNERVDKLAKAMLQDL